jgi:protein-L-isoaspartate(D-aspartate) O-methyltransferase
MVERTNPDEFRQQVQAAFDATGPAYGTPGDFHWQFAERLVHHAPLSTGQRVLDVATGTAPAAIVAARIVGAGGQVIGVDLSPGMLAHARRNIAAMGESSILLMQGSGDELPFLDEQFDVVLCSSSIVWFPNIHHALQEWHRLLKPGGWVAFSCFGGLARYTTQTLLGAVLKPYGIVYFDLNEPLNTPEKCHQAVAAAGFVHVAVHIDQETTFTTNPLESFSQAHGGARRLQLQLSHAQAEQARTSYMAGLQELLATQEMWNNDFEQLVVAQRPA